MLCGCMHPIHQTTTICTYPKANWLYKPSQIPIVSSSMTLIKYQYMMMILLLIVRIVLYLWLVPEKWFTHMDTLAKTFQLIWILNKFDATHSTSLCLRLNLHLHAEEVSSPQWLGGVAWTQAKDAAIRYVRISQISASVPLQYHSCCTPFLLHTMHVGG